ncbi:MAG: orotidine-5'-phosphate decarboxylase [Phycisphaerae bacterium]
MQCFSDRLCRAVLDKKTPLIVGIDPVLEQMPPTLLEKKNVSRSSVAAAGLFLEFGLAIIEIAAPLVPAVKINSAYFERYHAPGVSVYRQLVKAARQAGLLVIGDVKRSDIGHTASQYAVAQLADTDYTDLIENAGPDAITVNAYLGSDSVKPFLDVASASGKGVFVLVRTSNPGSAEIQELPMADGRPLYVHMAELVNRWDTTVGEYGWSSLGAVVGATTGQSLAAIRAAAGRAVFLIPGFGAQGGSLTDCLPALDARGLGAMIAASRSIIYAYRDAKYVEPAEVDWRRAVEQALIDHKTQISALVKYA